MRAGNGHCAALAVRVGAAILPCAPVAAAMPLNDQKHVSWSLEGGAPSRINAIGQSRDGYLWLGSVEGLFRFDGVSFEPIRPDGEARERLVVADVLGARSGDVWVGLARGGGLLVYRRGHLLDAHMPRPSREVTALAEDRDGAIWVARGGRSTDTLARFRRGRWEEIGAARGLPRQRIWDLLAARDGTLWVALANTVLRLAPGAARFEDTGASVTPRAAPAGRCAAPPRSSARSAPGAAMRFGW